MDVFLSSLPEGILGTIKKAYKETHWYNYLSSTKRLLNWKAGKTSFCVPAAFLQSRHRQQFVPSQQIMALAEAGSAVTWGCVLCHHMLILQGGENLLLSLLAGAHYWCQKRIWGMGMCALEQPWRFMKQDFLKAEPDDPCAAPSTGMPTLPTRPNASRGTELLWCTAAASLGSHRLAAQKVSPGTPGIKHSLCWNQADSKCLAMEKSLFPLPLCDAISVCSELVVPVCSWMGQEVWEKAW